MQKVFIVILNWNRPKDTLECLGSVARLKRGNFTLNTVVVDNGSTEKIPELQESKIPSKIKIIENKKNLGFAGGNNVGINYALENGADYILILNNDTTLHTDLLVHLIESARSNLTAGIFSPKIYFTQGFEFHKEKYQPGDLGKVIWYAGGKMDWNNVYGKNFGVDEVDRGQFNEKKELDFATGAAMLVRCQVWKDIGLFNPKYFTYFEDTEFSARAKRAGWKILFVPKAMLWHKVAQSSDIGSNLNDYFITRNRLLFGIKYAPLRAKVALMRESVRFVFSGRPWQRQGVLDYYLARFGKGSWT